MGRADQKPVWTEFGTLVVGSDFPHCECDCFRVRVIPAEKIPKSAVTRNALSP